MGILDFLKRKPEPTAVVAKERLRIIVAQERSNRGAPDYLPLLRNDEVGIESIQFVRWLVIVRKAGMRDPAG